MGQSRLLHRCCKKNNQQEHQILEEAEEKNTPSYFMIQRHTLLASVFYSRSFSRSWVK